MRKDFFLITIGILLILLNITLSVALPFCEMQTGDWILCTETKAGQFNTTSPAITVEFREPVRGLSLGQSIVFYSGDPVEPQDGHGTSECLGGAVMDAII